MSRRLSFDGEFVSAAITPSYGFVFLGYHWCATLLHQGYISKSALRLCRDKLFDLARIDKTTLDAQCVVMQVMMYSRSSLSGTGLLNWDSILLYIT